MAKKETPKQYVTIVRGNAGAAIVDVVIGTRDQAVAFARAKTDNLGLNGVTVHSTEIVDAKVTDLTAKEG